MRNTIRKTECPTCGGEVKDRRVPKSGQWIDAIGCAKGCCWIKNREGYPSGVKPVERTYVDVQWFKDRHLDWARQEIKDDEIGMDFNDWIDKRIAEMASA